LCLYVSWSYQESNVNDHLILYIYIYIYIWEKGSIDSKSKFKKLLLILTIDFNFNQWPWLISNDFYGKIFLHLLLKTNHETTFEIEPIPDKAPIVFFLPIPSSLSFFSLAFLYCAWYKLNCEGEKNTKERLNCVCFFVFLTKCRVWSKVQS